MNEKKMAYPKGMEKHGNCWRIKKRTPVALQAHYPGQQWHKFSTTEPDKKTAAALVMRWQADLEEEFERLRTTGSKFKQGIAASEIAHLVALMVHSSLTADEESRETGDYADDEDYATALARLDTAEGETRKALSQRVYRGDLPAIVKDWLRGYGYDIPAESDAFRGICLEFAKGRLEAVKARRMRNTGEWIATPPLPAAPPSSSANTSTAPLVSTLADWFLDRQDQSTPMYRKHKQAVGLFAETFGSRPADTLKQADIESFCATLCRLPPRWTKERKSGKTASEIAAQGWPECITETTFNKTYRASLSVFLKDCSHVYGDAGFPRHLNVTRTPYTGSRKGGEDKQRALKPDELKRLYEGTQLATFAADPEQAHCYWLPLVGLYTGARVNEVCQLNPQCDIQEQDGVWFFAFTEDSEADERITKSVKNTSSRRRVPIHSQLLALGFLSYVEKVKEQGHSLLFPKWHPKAGKASGKAREWFSDWLREIGLRDETPGKCITGFHCFRHTLMTKAANTPGLPWPIENITGHSTGGHSKDAEGYKGGELELPNKVRILEMITFDIAPPRPA